MSIEIKLPEVSRRQFLKYALASGTGLLIGAALERNMDSLGKGQLVAPTTYPPRIPPNLVLPPGVYPPRSSADSVPGQKQKWPPKPLRVIDETHPYTNPVTGVLEIDYNPELNREELMQFLQRMDRLTDVLTPPKAPTNSSDLDWWVKEIYPYFSLEGVKDKAVKPTSVGFKDYPDGMDHVYLYGEAHCSTGEIYLNGRTQNPTSPWYGKGKMIWTLIHEMTHLQDLCGGRFFGVPETEASTQIVTAEVAAAMVREEHEAMTWVLLDGLRYMAVASLYYKSINEDKIEEYVNFMADIYNDPFQQAHFQKWKEIGKENMGGFKEVLNMYNNVPLQRIIKGLRDEKISISTYPKGSIPSNTEPYDFPYSYYQRPSIPKDLECKDLIYVLTNAEALVAKLSNSPNNSQKS